MVSRRRRVGIAVVVLAAALVLGSCQVARAGTRCRTPGVWGQDSTHILRCQNRRWTRVMTKADYARFLLAVQQQRQAEEEAARAAAAAAAAAARPKPPPPAPKPDPCTPVSTTGGYQAVYVLPADGVARPSVAAAIRHELGLVTAWFRRETGGSSPRLLRDATGAVSVCALRIAATRAQLDQAGGDRFYLIESQVKSKLPAGDRAVLAYTDYNSGSVCGSATVAFAIIYFGTCGSPNAAAPTPGDFDDTVITTAHELVHTMGAAEACAPNHDGLHPGHVLDEWDILYYGQFAGDELSDLLLDPGNDDYYGHGRTDCPDIVRAPWWQFG